MTDTPGMVLQGARVSLRELQEEDLDAVVAVVGDARVTDWLSFDPRSREQTREMIRGVIERRAGLPRQEYYLGIASPTEGLAGFVRIALGGHRAAKLGYAVAHSSWGRGYATDAARTLTGHAFGALGLHRVTAAIGPTNTASVRVVERLGFAYEGRLRDHVFTNGAWRDSLLYSVLSHQWAPLR